MEKSSKRGKIPQQDWPSIITRYEAGETLASIARTYDCSPPAISYIVSRTKARSAAAEAAVQTTPATAAEPQLLKGPSSEVPTSNIPAAAMLHGTAATGAASPLELPVTEPRLIEQPAGAPQPREPGLFPDEPPQAPNLPANPVSSAGNGPIRATVISRAATLAQPATATRSVHRVLPEGSRRTANRDEPCTCRCLTETAAHTVPIRCTKAPQTSPMPAPETVSIRIRPRNRPLANLHGRVRSIIVPRRTLRTFPRGPMLRRCVSPMGCAIRLQIAPPARGSAAGKVVRLSIGRFENGSMAISPSFSQRSTPPSIATPPRLAPNCARQPIGCCGPGPVRESNWNASRRAHRCRRGTRSGKQHPYSGIAEVLV